MGDVGQLVDDLPARALVMGSGIGGVAVLERHEVPPILGHAPGDLDRPVRPLLRRAEDDLRAEELEEADTFVAGVVGHHGHHPVALPPSHHGERDPRVAAGGLEDDPVGRQLAGCLGILDHRPGDTVLQ
jgi:hypothetical protein